MAAGGSVPMSMPPISASDQLAANVDLALFSALGAMSVGLRWLFAIAIAIGILRALALSALAFTVAVYVAVMACLLAASALWTRRFSRGPIEMLMHRAA